MHAHQKKSLILLDNVALFSRWYNNISHRKFEVVYDFISHHPGHRNLGLYFIPSYRKPAVFGIFYLIDYTPLNVN